MNYSKNLRGRILDSTKWPSVERPEFLDRLNVIADEAIRQRRASGYLTAILIYHQLAEELFRLILQCAQLLIQARMYPVEIRFPERKNTMFGRLLDDVASTVEFPRKAELLALARRLNDARIKVVHGLTKHTSLTELRKSAAGSKKLFDSLFREWESCYDWFREALRSVAKDWDEEGSLGSGGAG